MQSPYAQIAQLYEQHIINENDIKVVSEETIKNEDLLGKIIASADAFTREHKPMASHVYVGVLEDILDAARKLQTQQQAGEKNMADPAERREKQIGEEILQEIASLKFRRGSEGVIFMNIKRLAAELIKIHS